MATSACCIPPERNPPANPRLSPEEAGKAWKDALDSYRYKVDLSKLESANTYQVRFSGSLASGDRSATAEFEDHFRKHARNSLDPWCEVIFWKLHSQRRFWRNAFDLIDRLRGCRPSPSELWSLTESYLSNPDKETLRTLAKQFVKGRNIATVATFAAFAAPDRFPIVDQQAAKWVNANRARFNEREGEEILAPFHKGLLTLSHWPAVRKWNAFCAEARRLRAIVPIEPTWRPRDVEMAVWQARDGLTLPPLR